MTNNLNSDEMLRTVGFEIPYAYVRLPSIIMYDRDLDVAAKCIYYALLHRSQFDTDTFISMSRLGEDLGISLATVKRRIFDLRSYGLIKVINRTNDAGGKTSNIYQIVHPANVYGRELVKQAYYKHDEIAQAVKTIRNPLYEQERKKKEKAVEAAAKKKLCLEDDGSQGAMGGIAHSEPSPIAHTELSHSSQGAIKYKKTDHAEEKEIHTPSSMEEACSPIGVEKGNNKEENNKNGETAQDRDNSQVGVRNPSFDVALKIAGTAMNQGQDTAIMQLRKAAAEKKKLEDTEQASNRHLKKLADKKAKAKIPDGVTEEEWQKKTCAKIFHDCFKDTMREFGHHAPTFATNYLGTWQHKFLPKVGTVENGIRVIIWVVQNWSTIQRRTGITEPMPTINLLASGYMDSFIGQLLSKGGKLAQPVDNGQQPQDENEKYAAWMK